MLGRRGTKTLIGAAAALMMLGAACRRTSAVKTREPGVGPQTAPIRASLAICSRGPVRGGGWRDHRRTVDPVTLSRLRPPRRRQHSADQDEAWQRLAGEGLPAANRRMSPPRTRDRLPCAASTRARAERGIGSRGSTRFEGFGNGFPGLDQRPEAGGLPCIPRIRQHDRRPGRLPHCPND
jgi:hypothetical protein